MATLSQVTATTRKLLEFIGIGIGAIILLVVLFNIGKAIKEIIAPTPPTPPTVAFGKLPSIIFPINTNMQPLTYSINTLTGALPSLSDRMTIYKLQQPQPNLVNLNKAKAIAATAGFRDDPSTLSDTSYRWTATNPDANLNESFTMDIQSFDFLFSTSYLSNQTVLSGINMPDEDTAVKAATDFFSKVSPLPNNIDTSKTKTTLWSITNGQLTPATSVSNAQIIRVDFFPKNIEALPIYTSTPDDSFTYAFVASSDTNNPQIVEAQLYHKIPTNDKATYPIKTAQQAFEDLKKGNGYIASAPDTTTQISITNVSLGYYLDNNSQDFLLPIIVFQGDKGFFAYVPALGDDWTVK